MDLMIHNKDLILELLNSKIQILSSVGRINEAGLIDNVIYKDTILFYPLVLILLAIIFRKISFGKIPDQFISIIQIITTNWFCTKTVEICRPGDFLSYKSFFEICTTIKDCFVYSPFEKSFTFFIGFAGEYMSLNPDQLWSLINFINLILITYISFLLSKYFLKKASFLSIQFLLIGTSFNTFLTISVRAGLAFLLVSLAIYKIITKAKTKFFLKDNFSIFTIFALSLTIHIQSVLLVLLGFVLLIAKYRNLNLRMIDNFQSLIKGFISKRILKILFFISLGNAIIFFNFRKILDFLGKTYYALRFFGSINTLGIRTIAQQFVIYFFILREIRNSSFYRENRSFSNFLQIFNLFQVISFVVYYSVRFVFGIDGFARQMQYNFMLYVVLYISSMDKLTLLKLLPFAFLIYEVYYTIMNDVSFANPYC